MTDWKPVELFLKWAWCGRKVEGLPGVLGNKGILAKYRREQGNMSLFSGNRETKLYKLEDENILI